MADEDRITDPSVVRSTWYWVKDANGRGSITATLVLVSFWATTTAYVLSIFEKIGPVSINHFDVAACASYMGPILTLYGARKWTDSHYGNAPNLGQPPQ